VFYDKVNVSLTASSFSMFGGQPIGSIEDWYKALTIKDSGILYEDPYVQVC